MAKLVSDVSLPLSDEMLNNLNSFGLLGALAIQITDFDEGLNGYFEIDDRHRAPNGFLHAGSVVSLADTLCGIGCQLKLPPGAEGFVTIELKTNFLSSASQGKVFGSSQMVHGGRTTQVWDCQVTSEFTKRVMAEFRCTQLVLYPTGQ